MEENENEVKTHSYTCQRCGFVYNLNNDSKPFLCLRCLRFIAKRTFSLVNSDTYTERKDT